MAREPADVNVEDVSFLPIAISRPSSRDTDDLAEMAALASGPAWSVLAHRLSCWLRPGAG